MNSEVQLPICPTCGERAEDLQRVDVAVSWASHRHKGTANLNWEYHMWTVWDTDLHPRCVGEDK